jgi:hypothetical protein
MGEQRLREERIKNEENDPKTIFKQYLDNSFPKHRVTLKKIMRFFLILEQH